MARPTVHGVRVLALDAEGRLLLVRHTYGAGGWLPPSGGLPSRADPLAAAARELAEETGCFLVAARVVAVIEESLHGARNRVHVVAGRTDDHPRPDRREIAHAGWFALHALPLPEDAAERLRGWLQAWAVDEAR